MKHLSYVVLAFSLHINSNAQDSALTAPTYIRDTISLNRTTIVVRSLVMAVDETATPTDRTLGKDKPYYYLLSSDTISSHENGQAKLYLKNNAGHRVNDLLITNRPEGSERATAPSKSPIPLPTEVDSSAPQDTEPPIITLSLPLIEIPNDSVAFYMEFLRRLGNREDISDMITDSPITTTSLSPPKTETTSITAYPIDTEQSYTTNANFYSAEQMAYLQMIDNISTRRTAFAELYKKNSNSITKNQVLEEAAKYLTETITSVFVPQIVGKWLSPPQIAANDDVAQNKYLISVLLRDFGFALDFDLLQQSSARTISKSLANENVLKYCKNFDELDDYLVKKGRGLYIVSYEQYIALIWNSGIETYLILADPLNDSKVVQTQLQKASAFQKYVPYFNIGSMTDNAKLVRDWLMENKIAIQK